MPRPLRHLRALFLALVVARSAAAAPKLPPEIDAKLTKAEGILGKTTGEERLVACIDALPLIEEVAKAAPDYAYVVGLQAECLFMTDQFKPAIAPLSQYLTLVPMEARKGKTLEKVQRAEDRLRTCWVKLGMPEAPMPSAANPWRGEAQPTGTAVSMGGDTNAREGSVDVGADLPLPPLPSDEPGSPHRQPRPPSPPWTRHLNLRAGTGPSVGGVGIGGEFQFGPLHAGLGLGTLPSVTAGFGLSLGPGRLFAEGHASLITSLIVKRSSTRAYLGGELGYDLRLFDGFTIKGSFGATHETDGGRPYFFVAEISAGLTFPL